MRILSIVAASAFLACAGLMRTGPVTAAPAPQHRGADYPPRGGIDPPVSCGSPRNRLQRCAVPNYWRGAQLVRQTSHAACVQGRTWGFDRDGIWVDKGCGGVFAAGNYSGGWQPGPDWNRDFAVPCGSPQYKYYFCQVDVGARGHVVLQRQSSDTRCVEGGNWGWNRAGIWVDKGCGGQFLVTRRW